MTSASSESGTGTLRRRGRTAGIVVFAAIVAGFTAVCSVEILMQVWAPGESAPEGPCRPAVGRLIQAVHRARAAAASQSGGEREALQRFRAALEPDWSFRTSLARRCAGDADARRALADVDRLRYAEEHAVRYEAVDVAGARRRVEAIKADLFAQD